MKMPLCSLVIALTLLGCGDKSKTTDTSSTASSKPAEPNYASAAFMMGRNYGFAESQRLMDNQPEVAKKMKEVEPFAKVLGVDAPAAPTEAGSWKERGVSIASTIEKKRDPKTAAAFSLGFDVTMTWFGAMIGSDTVKDDLASIEALIKKCDVPESAWKAKFDAAKAAPTEPNVKDLAKALEGHFKSG